MVAYGNDLRLACGAIKEFEINKIEVKHMYALPEYWDQGLATKVLKELEEWAAELDYDHTVLETGKRQQEAMVLYKKTAIL